MMKAEVSIPVALATAGVVVGVFAFMQPTSADQRTVVPGSDQERMLAGSENQAFLTAVAAVGAISLIAQDPVPFWVGGGLAVALSWASRYSRNVDPQTNRLPGLGGSLTGRRFVAEAAGGTGPAA